MNFYIETERLILRDLLQSDVDGMFEMDSNSSVHRYLGQQPILSVEQALENINFIRKQYLDFGIGRWAVIEKSTGSFTGWAGLKWITEEINGHSCFYDLGYRFLPQFWNKGFASETAQASISYAFTELKIDELYAITHIENNASAHVLQKSGFKITETFDYKDMHCNWLELKNKELAEAIR